MTPISTPPCPKPYMPFFDPPLIVQTLSRVQDLGEPYFLTTENLKNLTAQVLNRYKASRLQTSSPVNAFIDKYILAEPEGKNTAAAIAFLCLKLLKTHSKKTVVGFFPSDHWIGHKKSFLKTMRTATQEAHLQNKIILVGILPQGPREGLGYLRVHKNSQLKSSSEVYDSNKLWPVIEFIEKPHLKKAKELFQKYPEQLYFNSGIYIASLETLKNEFEVHQPVLWQTLERALLNHDSEALRSAYKHFPSLSIDYAISEKSKNILCLEAPFLWSDLGTWDDIINTVDGLVESDKARLRSHIHRVKIVPVLKEQREVLVAEYRESAFSKQDLEKAYEDLINNKSLGYLQLHERTANWSVSENIGHAIKKNFKKLYVIGLGGSHWAGQVWSSLAPKDIQKNIIFCNETHPQNIAQFLSLDLDNKSAWNDAHFLVISKSGKTLEIAVWVSALEKALKVSRLEWSQHVSVITEETNNPLHRWAQENHFRVIPHPQDVGGRFSVFTPVGLVPAFFAGLNGEDIRQGQIAALQDKESLFKHAQFVLKTFAQNLSITVFWSYVYGLEPFLKWLEQLWAESLGQSQTRHGQSAPFVSTPLLAHGVSSQHSVLQQYIDGAKDKSFIFFRDPIKAQSAASSMVSVTLKDYDFLNGLEYSLIYQSQSLATEEALRQKGAETLALEWDSLSEKSMAYWLMHFELLIGLLGELLNIDVYSQPGVELGKKLTLERLQSVRALNDSCRGRK